MTSYDALPVGEYAGLLRRAPAYVLDVVIVSIIGFALRFLLLSIMGSPQILDVTREREVSAGGDLGDGVAVWAATATERAALLCPQDAPVVTFTVGATHKAQGETDTFYYNTSAYYHASACGAAEGLRARFILQDGRTSADWPIATEEDVIALGNALLETYDRGSRTDPMEVLRSITLPAADGGRAALSEIRLVFAETGAPAPEPWLLVRWLPTALAVALFFLYFLILEHFTIAGSLGKMVFRCAVVTRDRQRLPFGASLARTAMKCFLPILTIVTVPFNRRRRALHDMLAGTFVVRSRALAKEAGPG